MLKYRLNASGLPRIVEISIFLQLLFTYVFQEFGINFGSYSLDFCLIYQYIVVVVLLLYGFVTLDMTRLVVFALLIITALLSFYFSESEPSSSSMLLMLVIYAPFCFICNKNISSVSGQLFAFKAFVSVACICAIAGTAQFLAQFFVHDPALFNFREALPYAIQGNGSYNTAISLGSFYKSNGFFLREPSIFCQLMALAILTEVSMDARLSRLIPLGFGVLISYSGTGLIALAVGIAFPLGPKTAIRIAIIIFLAIILIYALGDVLNLSVTLDRSDEFDAQGSSGYARFVGPFYLLVSQYEYKWFPNIFFGFGPGTITRQVIEGKFHDPTWAKSILEYGVIGSFLISTLIIKALVGDARYVKVAVGSFVTWSVLGGYLLSPEVTTQIFVLFALWPVKSRRCPAEPTS